MFFTPAMVFIILTYVIGFAQNKTLPLLLKMDSSDVYENLPKLPAIATPVTSLLQEVFQKTTPKIQEQILPLPYATQLIMDFIIKFHTYNQFVDHENIWEIDDDTFLIRLGEPHLYVVKCMLQEAILLNAKQIPFMTVTTHSLADQNKETLRIGQILAKFPDILPCIFQMQLNVSHWESSSIPAASSQKRILELLLNQAPLPPKTTVQLLKKNYEALCDKNIDKYFTHQDTSLKVHFIDCIIFCSLCCLRQNV